MPMRSKEEPFLLLKLALESLKEVAAFFQGQTWQLVLMVSTPQAPMDLSDECCNRMLRLL